MKVRIINKSHHPLPGYATPLSAGMDIRANLSESVVLKPLERKLIPTGLYISLPEGYEAQVAPRSSTFKNFGIIQTNGIGVIDNSYCGDQDEWRMPVYALRDTVIRKNDRICQFRIVEKQPAFTFQEVERLKGESRGGFGSTGIE